LVEDDAPLFFLFSALDMLGGAAVPCAMIALGSSLIKGPGGSTLSKFGIALIVTFRLVVMPLVGIGTAYLLLYMGLLPNDPVLRLVLIMEASMPTANNVVNMAQIAIPSEVGPAGEELATIVFWEYCFFLPSMLMWMPLSLPIIFHS
jgi:predicted permease